MIKIELPLTTTDIDKLRVGQTVYLTGPILTARDAAHKRLVETIINNIDLPIELQNQIIYYVGPCPAPKDHIIGAAGPTTSSRMDKFTPSLMAKGLKGMIGKGPRSQEVIEAIKKYHGVYFIACGGAGALLAQSITAVETVAYADLGTEAIRKLYVQDFPVIVAIDKKGDSLFV